MYGTGIQAICHLGLFLIGPLCEAHLCLGKGFTIQLKDGDLAEGQLALGAHLRNLVVRHLV